ncbi:MAG: hypothetical protein LH480_13555 [Rubrivivax sp.]|nr:hypothetical protein [Rubrivivax sp.]
MKPSLRMKPSLKMKPLPQAGHRYRELSQALLPRDPVQPSQTMTTDLTTSRHSLKFWTRFKQCHLFDYTPAATAMWVAVALAGAFALAWAVWQLMRNPPGDLASAAIALALVAIAALVPVQIPRTSQSVLVADVFVLTILATFGVPAAVLAAGMEALVGGLRSSKRLST